MGESDRLPKEVNSFLDDIRDWAIAINDPRVNVEKHMLTDVIGLSADFCGFMARVCEAGYESRNWRKAFMAGIR